MANAIGKPLSGWPLLTNKANCFELLDMLGILSLEGECQDSRVTAAACLEYYTACWIMAWQAIIIFWRITYMSSGIISGTMLRSKNIRNWNLLHDNTFSEVFRWKLELLFNDNIHFYRVFSHFTMYHQMGKSVIVFTRLGLPPQNSETISLWPLKENQWSIAG